MRIRECAILTGCLNHPALAAEFEDRLERVPFACADLEKIRDALLSSLGEALSAADPTKVLGNAIGRRTGQNPSKVLETPGQVRANRYLSADAHSDQARRAIDEELTRHAAILGKTAELLDAKREIHEGSGEGLTWRLGQAINAAHDADIRPLSESGSVSAEEEALLSRELEQMIERHNHRPPKTRA